MLLSSIEDKIYTCYSENCVQYTDFLTLEESASAQKLLDQNGLYYRFYGGFENAQRRMLAISITDSFEHFPMVALHGTWDKFGEITHRDVLGSFMATGIDRKCIGDILMDIENRSFYVFSVARMQDYFMQSISRIGRCSVSWEVLTDVENIPTALSIERRLSVSSLRVDVLIAAIWNLSRKQAQELIDRKMVFLDNVLVFKESQTVSTDTAIVVRGKGKAIFLEQCGLSKKGKTYILIKQYK